LGPNTNAAEHDRAARPAIPAKLPASSAVSLRLAYWVLALALVWGCVVRCVWPEDIEWKKDEQWCYRMGQEVGRTRPWPLIGMPTSLGIPNPGLSVWAFVPIGRLVSTPPSMARAIALLNVIALVGFAAAVHAYLPPTEREPWLWGLALQSVSPFAIRMSRKIWPPSLLMPFLLLLWVSHRHRQARWGSFAWGLVGTLIGQVHLSGWFVAAGLAIGTAVAEWRGALGRSRYWHWWLIGSLVGLVSALPWAYELPENPVAMPAASVVVLFKHAFACVYELTAAATSILPYTVLGLGRHTSDYEISPIVGGIPAHIPDALDGLIAALITLRIVVRLGVALVGPAVRWIIRRITARGASASSSDAHPPSEPKSNETRPASTGFYIWSMIALPCAIFVLTTNVYFYHYFFVMCPFLFVLLAALMLPWRRALLVLVIAQAVLGISFLSYIHERGGTTMHGEYGRTYARQANRQGVSSRTTFSP
jgi:uncharacterized membrane protein YhaH (DUF805 family)